MSSETGASTTSNGNGDDLIVGFSDRSLLRPQRDADSGNAAPPKQVRFSKNRRIYCFPYPSREEVSRRWYSPRDKRCFEVELVREVRDIRRLLATTPTESIEKEALYWCIGLEALITEQVAIFVKRKKRDHARSVEEMQYCLSGDQLASHAMNSSSLARERAQKIASGNYQILS